MVKIQKTTSLLMFLTIYIGIFFFVSCKNKDPEFIRNNLSITNKISKKIELIKETDKNIPVNSGIKVDLKGTEIIRLEIPYSGKTGILFYLNFKSSNEKGSISFELYKSGKKIKNKNRLHFVNNSSFDSEIIETFNSNKKEYIYMKFKGTGNVFISHPIIYKIIEKEKRDNIFIIGIDTLRMDMISKKVNKISLTPNFDLFMKDSVSFENCIAQSSWTLPSFISFFTSLYEFNHNVGIKNILDPDINNLITNFSKKYITMALHGGIVMSKRWGHSRGFDLYKEFKFAGPLYPYGGRSLFEKAIETLEKGNFSNLLLFLHTYQIHDPYTPPKEYLNMINKNPLHDRGDIINSGKPEQTFKIVSEKTKKSLIELYQAEIYAFDDFFGKFIDKLKKKKLYNSATIILMSDHGEEFFDHKGWGHSHSLYQELIKVPLIIKFPEKKYKGIRVKKNVSVIDILPTILEFKKIPFELNNIDGESILNMIQDPKASKNKPIVSSMTKSRYIDPISQKFAIIKDTYKVIFNYKSTKKQLDFFKKHGLPPKTSEIELYNLKKDPNENNNLYKKGLHIFRGFIPYIKNIKKIIEKNRLNNIDTNKKLDPEVEKQLKSIGYI